jgi:hypothetical protein
VAGRRGIGVGGRRGSKQSISLRSRSEGARLTPPPTADDPYEDEADRLWQINGITRHGLPIGVDICLAGSSWQDPTGKSPPVRQIRVQPSREKYFASVVGQIISTSSPRPTPARGACHDRQETRDGMRWTRQRRAREMCSQGGFAVSGHRRADERRFSPSPKFRRDRHMARWKFFGARCCGRRSRVVLASVADAKSAEARWPNRV